MTRWDAHSRDETEIGAFGDGYVSDGEIGGWFDSLMKKTGLKQKVEKKAGVKLQIKNPTAKQIATGLGKSAVMLAPIVLTGGGGAALAAAAPAALAAAPMAKSVLSTAQSAKQTVSPALKAAAAARAAAEKAARDARAKVEAEARAAKARADAAAKAAEAAKLAAQRDAAAKLAQQRDAAAKAAAALKARPAAPLSNVFAVQRPAALTPALRPRPETPMVAVAVKPAGLVAAAGALPRYLVLDSGQLLKGAAAQNRSGGWLVRADGHVVRV